MVKVRSIQSVGKQLHILMDDGTRQIAYSNGSSFWVASSAGGGVVDPPPGGGGDSTIYNPWGSQLSAGGDWQSHLDRTDGLRGGADWPLAWGTDLAAPGAGTLHTSGGTGEYAAGDQGSAGLRSILYLDTPVTRKQPAGNAEAQGPMAAIVFQHQSSMGVHMQHYGRGQILGKSGDTGNAVTHLHVHGLDAAGARVDFMKFV